MHLLRLALFFFAFINIISAQNRTCSDELIKSEVSETRLVEKFFKADIALLIDNSGSINDADYVKEIAFCQSIVSNFTVGPDHVRFGLIAFADDASQNLHWENGITDHVLRTQLQGMKQTGGRTNFEAPLKMVQDKFIASGTIRSDAEKVILLITDGIDNVGSKGAANEIASAMRSQKVVIVAVAVGAGVDTNRLVKITGASDRVIYVEHFNDLTKELGKIQREITRTYKDCVYAYVPDCKCHFNRSGVCVQEGKLNILETNHPAGKSCPTQSTVQLPCPASECHKQCDRWPWGVWLMCEKKIISIYHQNHENGTELLAAQNGTRIRYRSKQPVDYWMNFGCQYNQTEECDMEKQKKMFLKHIQKYNPCPEDHTRFYVNMCVFLVGGLLFLAAALLLAFNVVMFSGTWVSSVLPPKPVRETNVESGVGSNMATTSF